MKFTFFYHSLVSDWNHGNAHFLRGVVSDRLARGHQVQVFEPADAWSKENLVRDRPWKRARPQSHVLRTGRSGPPAA